MRVLAAHRLSAVASRPHAPNSAVSGALMAAGADTVRSGSAVSASGQKKAVPLEPPCRGADESSDLSYAHVIWLTCLWRTGSGSFFRQRTCLALRVRVMLEGFSLTPQFALLSHFCCAPVRPLLRPRPQPCPGCIHPQRGTPSCHSCPTVRLFVCVCASMKRRIFFMGV